MRIYGDLWWEFYRPHLGLSLRNRACEPVADAEHIPLDSLGTINTHPPAGDEDYARE